MEKIDKGNAEGFFFKGIEASEGFQFFPVTRKES